MFTCRPQVLPEVPDVLDGATVPNQNFERTQAQVFKFKLRSEWYVDIREVNEVNQIILMISFQSFLHLFFHQGTAMRTQYLRTIWPSCGQRVRRRSITRIKFLSLQSGKTIKYVYLYIYIPNFWKNTNQTPKLEQPSLSWHCFSWYVSPRTGKNFHVQDLIIQFIPT